jgi:hypothetical protein
MEWHHAAHRRFLYFDVAGRVDSLLGRHSVPMMALSGVVVFAGLDLFHPERAGAENVAGRRSSLIVRASRCLGCLPCRVECIGARADTSADTSATKKRRA